MLQGRVFRMQVRKVELLHGVCSEAIQPQGMGCGDGLSVPQCQRGCTKPTRRKNSLKTHFANRGQMTLCGFSGGAGRGGATGGSDDPYRKKNENAASTHCIFVGALPSQLEEASGRPISPDMGVYRTSGRVHGIEASLCQVVIFGRVELGR